jgi:hypothetical protein
MQKMEGSAGALGANAPRQGMPARLRCAPYRKPCNWLRAGCLQRSGATWTHEECIAARIWPIRGDPEVSRPLTCKPSPHASRRTWPGMQPR